MMDYAHICVAVLVALAILCIKPMLYPTPYPGIPFNESSAKRLMGDLPDLLPIVQETTEFSNSVLTLTTRRLGTPIAQFLFPTIRRPLIVLEDPYEIEDILLRRNREFDKAPFAVAMYSSAFPKGTLSQFATPELKAQKRLWAEALSHEFLRKTAAANIYVSALELIELWRLKATGLHKDKPFEAYQDLQNAGLDAIWVTVANEQAGLTRYEIDKLQRQIQGRDTAPLEKSIPSGIILKEEIVYISDAIARNSSSPSPVWAQKLETYRPRYRRFRANIVEIVSKVMRKAVRSFENREKLDNDDADTCMMDRVLRRQIVEANKTGKTLIDPVKDPRLLDELFVILVGGYDSTSNTLSWFITFMEAYPEKQTELRAALREAFPGEPPSVEEIMETNIPYLDAASEETVRLSGTAKATLRQALVDTEILGYKIPKGAEIMMNLHNDYVPLVIDPSRRHSSSRATLESRGDGFRGHAGRDIARFEPKRWLVRDESGNERFDAYALPQLIFGGGYRGCTGKSLLTQVFCSGIWKCFTPTRRLTSARCARAYHAPGRKLASMELRIIIVLLVLNFEFLKLPDELRTTHGIEKVFREPDKPYAKIRAL
ncbi:cytochrome P450 [Xylariaceae sp. FL1272]|nr:cytochrome P450 [Xylariaceae sp. FL1272]